jgi:predicted nuclease of predicted toxin-antitoxin system
LVDYALTPVFQFNYTKGKNASDSAMVIDAMDILYSGKVTGFCLVTSDSDFTKLAIRLREAGMLVVGMGERKTPGSMVAACETFKYLDLLYNDEEKGKGEDEAVERASLENREHKPYDRAGWDMDINSIPDKGTVGAEITSIIEVISDENGWAFLGTLGNMLAKRIPGFDPRNYGYRKLKSFIESYDCYQTQETSNPKNSFLKLVYVKMKQEKPVFTEDTE